MLLNNAVRVMSSVCMRKLLSVKIINQVCACPEYVYPNMITIKCQELSAQGQATFASIRSKALN